MPRRVQRTRTKGGGMPAGAVYVGRPTKWGNPFPVGVYLDAFGRALHGNAARRIAVAEYRQELLHGRLAVTVEDVRRELRGKDLACWCALPADGEEDLCHAAVLLEAANEAP